MRSYLNFVSFSYIIDSWLQTFYLSTSVSIAKQLREGTLKDDEALAEKVKNAYGEHMYERIISVAKKLLKYPDIARAAYGPVYKETIDK